MDDLSGKSRVRFRVVLAGTLLLVLLRGPAVVSMGWGNSGVLIFRDRLMAQTDFAPNTYPVYGTLVESPAITRAMQGLHRAVAWDKFNLPARWALGRAALAVGERKVAAYCGVTGQYRDL